MHPFDRQVFQHALKDRALTAKEELQVYRLRAQFLELIHNDENSQFNDQRLQFAKSLETLFPTAREYLLFHILIGSSPKTFCDCFDLPKAHSVRAFFNKACQQYQVYL